LTNVARASLEELLEDYKDYIKNRKEIIWDKDSREALYVRKLAYSKDESYENTYEQFIETRSGVVCANIILCLIHQCNYLLDQQIRRLEEDFVKNGGLRERMYQARKNYKIIKRITREERTVFLKTTIIMTKRIGRHKSYRTYKTYK